MTPSIFSLLADLSALNTKLILVTGASRFGKSELVRSHAALEGNGVLNVGLKISGRLVPIPVAERPFEVHWLLQQVASGHVNGDILYLDNLEVLFDPALKLDPLAQLKLLARRWRVVAVWPGEMAHDRLVYAELGHPEYRSYPLDGFVPYPVQPN
jgi:hypothetical protein